MDYIAELVVRESDDRNGQLLCIAIESQLTYLSSSGLDEFFLTPVLGKGRTIGVVITARGMRPSMFEAKDAFETLTGLKDAKEIGDFLGVKAETLQRKMEMAVNQEQWQQQSVRSAGEIRMEYTAELLEREENDPTGCELASLMAMQMTYMSDNGLSGFLVVPVQNDGETISVILAARGKRPGAQVPVG